MVPYFLRRVLEQGWDERREVVRGGGTLASLA